MLVLQGAHNRFPDNAAILNALAAFHRDQGTREAAQLYARKLRALQDAAQGG